MATITANKTLRTLLASTANAAGATTNSAAWDVSTCVGEQELEVVITNGATGPTLPCLAVLQLSRDGGANWVDTPYQRAGVPATANARAAHGIKVPPGYRLVRVRFAGNTGQAVTIEAYGHEVTSLSST